MSQSNWRGYNGDNDGGGYLLSMCSRRDAGGTDMAVLLVQVVKAISACLDRFKIRIFQNFSHGDTSARVDIQHTVQ